jgi:benzoate-CoA ligase
MQFALDTYAKRVLKITEADITFSASKLFFAYGLGNGMYFPLGVGASTVLMPDRPLPEKVFETIEKYRPTIFFGVPTLYGSMIDLVERSGKTYDLSSIRVSVSAGESLPAKYVRKWRELFGTDILDGLGSTEVLHIFLSNQIGDIREGSSGKLVPGYEAKIVNEMGVALSANETGDLLVKGDSIAHGYWNLHEENKRKFSGEWLHTGDKYYVDEEGYFWYCGRSDDMIKVGGIWVSPIEIENALLQHEAVLEVAVVGVQQEENLTHPKAFVVLKNGVTPLDSLKKDMQDYLKQRLAPYKYPRLIEFVDELPKTSTGKIQRFKLRIS